MYHLLIGEVSPIKNPLPLRSFFDITMDSIIEQLASQQVWEVFLAHRLEKGRLNWREFEAADSFVENKQYLDEVQRIIGGGSLGIPRKILINKQGTGKKRVVYSFGEEQMVVLKALSYLLYKYDNYFAPNCYAFRRGRKASDGVVRLQRAVRDKHLWAYKLDIHNYFNSISVPILLEQLAQLLADDKPLYDFFEQMLANDAVEQEGKIVHEEHGAMAGVPTAQFLANVYLRDMDKYFFEQGVVYARYSDDIIVFAESQERLQQYKAKIMEFLAAHRLEVNPSKERIYAPDEPFEFLGFKCWDSYIDISASGLEKMKGKIRRKTKALLRWKKRRGIAERKVVGRMIKYFNRKFYDCEYEQSLSWARWYFPIINRTEGLKEIDHYLQQSIRTLGTGRHTKANYRISYDMMKELGYKNLVHEYFAKK